MVVQRQNIACNSILDNLKAIHFYYSNYSDLSLNSNRLIVCFQESKHMSTRRENTALTRIIAFFVFHNHSKI